MAFQTAFVVDNRDPQEIYGYLEARVEMMKRRIQELEKENGELRTLVSADALQASA